ARPAPRPAPARRTTGRERAPLRTPPKTTRHSARPRVILDRMNVTGRCTTATARAPRSPVAAA
ncbi:hypothetical protein, partial [Streptomyces sp. NEAU-H3]|uniref:hypothetical protein n=1 Tax=Streptomyces sp. NEAU-H3 TaxID=2720636 RepID=UPI001ADA96FA